MALTERVFVVSCRPRIPSYQCAQCRRAVCDSRKCDWCASDNVRAQWHLDLTLQHTEGARVRAITLPVVGAVLDPLMAMTVDDYLRLAVRFGNLDGYVRRFYERTALDIGRRDRDLLAISLPPGSQLTFLNWLGLQPRFDIGVLVCAVLAWDGGAAECGPPEESKPIRKSDTLDTLIPHG